MPEYCGPNRRSEKNCEQAELAARTAVRDVFAILGVDVDNPQQVEEFRKSLRWGDSMRKAADKGFVAVVLAIVALLFGALVTGLRIKIGG